MQLANLYRPRTFSETVGQTGPIALLRRIVINNLQPSLLLFTGPFGTGKTTLARATARALFCTNRTPDGDACLQCPDCLIGLDPVEGMKAHLSFGEVDAPSCGSIADMRTLKGDLEFRSGSALKVQVIDEAHGLTRDAQDSLLKLLEEGVKGIMFMFASTDPQKILSTVRSRAIELRMRLLTAVETAARLRAICVAEHIEADDVALRLVATFAKGHLRDAVMTLEQLSQLGSVTEATARAFLRLDRRDEVYDLLLTADVGKALPKLEQLLCTYAFGELQELVAQVLMDAFKVGIGVGEFAQADLAYLQKIKAKFGHELVPLAESILLAPSDVGTLQYGCSVFINRFWSDKSVLSSKPMGLQPGDMALVNPGYGSQFRKPS